MVKSRILVAALSALVISCAAQPQEPQLSETQEIIDNLKQAGFPADDIMVVDGKVYVGRDAEVSLTASREMLETGDTAEEQYRTTNLVSPTITKICIDGSTFTGAFSTGLDLAIQNYNALPLSFSMARTPSTGCSFTINTAIQPGLVGGSAGFPSGGLPYSTVIIGDGLAPYGVDVIEHVITHEIGHTIGFRHSDFYNRTISCGVGGDEGDGGVGAIHIPGTPTTAVAGGSLMNSCFNPADTGEFTSTDVTALRTLYPVLDYPIAFQANTGSLWVIGPGGPGNTSLGMAAGTSPSLTRLTNGGIQVAFQANTGSLWTWGSAGTGDLGFGMAPGTSPSITALPNGGYQIAFQANTGTLWHTGSAGTANTNFGMAAGTSPSITGLAGSGFQIAFQANTGMLYHTGSAGTANVNLGMAAGTSPSIASRPAGGFDIAVQANTGMLWKAGSTRTFDLGAGMARGTSPGAR